MTGIALFFLLSYFCDSQKKISMDAGKRTINEIFNGHKLFVLFHSNRLC